MSSNIINWKIFRDFFINISLKNYAIKATWVKILMKADFVLVEGNYEVFSILFYKLYISVLTGSGRGGVACGSSPSDSPYGSAPFKRMHSGFDLSPPGVPFR